MRVIYFYNGPLEAVKNYCVPDKDYIMDLPSLGTPHLLEILNGKGNRSVLTNNPIVLTNEFAWDGNKCMIRMWSEMNRQWFDATFFVQSYVGTSKKVDLLEYYIHKKFVDSCSPVLSAIADVVGTTLSHYITNSDDRNNAVRDVVGVLNAGGALKFGRDTSADKLIYRMNEYADNVIIDRDKIDGFMYAIKILKELNDE